MAERIPIVDGAAKRDPYIRFGQSHLITSALLDDPQQRCADAAASELGMYIAVCSKLGMSIFVGEFFIPNHASVAGFHEKSIPFQFKSGSFPFLLQLVRCDRND